MALHLPIGSLKTRSGLEPVSRCEPSTYQPTAPSGSVTTRSLRERDVVRGRATAHGVMHRRINLMVDILSYFSFQPVIHDWCNKDRRMCYHVCVMMFIKEPLLLIVVAAEDFLSDYLSGPLLHVRCHNTVNKIFNKTFPSFHIYIYCIAQSGFGMIILHSKRKLRQSK